MNRSLPTLFVFALLVGTPARGDIAVVPITVPGEPGQAGFHRIAAAAPAQWSSAPAPVPSGSGARVVSRQAVPEPGESESAESLRQPARWLMVLSGLAIAGFITLRRANRFD